VAASTLRCVHQGALALRMCIQKCRRARGREAAGAEGRAGGGRFPPVAPASDGPRAAEVFLRGSWVCTYTFARLGDGIWGQGAAALGSDAWGHLCVCECVFLFLIG
jgi:hypothetical protein